MVHKPYVASFRDSAQCRLYTPYTAKLMIISEFENKSFCFCCFIVSLIFGSASLSILNNNMEALSIFIFFVSLIAICKTLCLLGRGWFKILFF